MCKQDLFLFWHRLVTYCTYVYRMGVRDANSVILKVDSTMHFRARCRAKVTRRADSYRVSWGNFSRTPKVSRYTRKMLICM